MKRKFIVSILIIATMVGLIAFSKNANADDEMGKLIEDEAEWIKKNHDTNDVIPVVKDYMKTPEYIALYGVPFDNGYWILDNKIWVYNPPRKPDGSVDYDTIYTRQTAMNIELEKIKHRQEEERIKAIEENSNIRAWSGKDTKQDEEDTDDVEYVEDCDDEEEDKPAKDVEICKYCGNPVTHHQKNCGRDYDTDFVVD